MQTTTIVAIETTEQRVMRIRRQRVADLLAALPDITGANGFPYSLASCAEPIRQASSPRYMMEDVRGLLQRLVAVPEHASAARVALDALGLLWAVL